MMINNNSLHRKFLYCSLVFIHLVFFSLVSKASSVDDESKLEELPVNSYFVQSVNIRSSILVLTDLVDVDIKSARQVVNDIKLKIEEFNFAEQYLVLIAQAQLANQRGAYLSALNYLKQAKQQVDKISIQQLNQPVFFKYDLILAKSHEGLKQYKLALVQKEIYLEKYHEYSATRHEDTILRLTKKYNVLQKNKEIQFLSSENALKEVQLEEKQRLTQDKQRNVLLTVSSLMIFILLFFRELSVRKKLLLLSKTDALTCVFNRTTFLKQGNALFGHNNQMEISVLLLGIDSFKYINDKFGHKIGDKVLKELAMLGKESMRSTDVFARVSGDEFIALLPDTCIDEAKAIAEHIRDKISNYCFVKHDFGQQITVTIGVSSTEQVNDNLDDLIHAADLAMIQGKLSGKNQTQDYANIHAY